MKLKFYHRRLESSIRGKKNKSKNGQDHEKSRVKESWLGEEMINVIFLQQKSYESSDYKNKFRESEVSNAIRKNQKHIIRNKNDEF